MTALLVLLDVYGRTAKSYRGEPGRSIKVPESYGTWIPPEHGPSWFVREYHFLYRRGDVFFYVESTDMRYWRSVGYVTAYDLHHARDRGALLAAVTEQVLLRIPTGSLRTLGVHVRPAELIPDALEIEAHGVGYDDK